MTLAEKRAVYDVLRSKGTVVNINGQRVLLLPQGVSGLNIGSTLVTNELEEYINDTHVFMHTQDMIIFDDMDKYPSEDSL